MPFSKSPFRFLLAFALFLVLFYHLKSFGRTPQAPIVFVKSTFDWADVTVHHPPPSLSPVPVGKPLDIKIQHDFGKPSKVDIEVQGKRREAVRKAFQRCWKSYKKHAWMRDELQPLTATGRDKYGGWGATLFDSLDTLWIFDLRDDFYEAVRAAASIDWSKTPDTACNIFETTIRHLGGMLSAYELSGEPALLQKATEMGDMLYMGFDTPNRLPGFWLDYAKAKAGTLEAGTNEPSAASGSLSMEFTRLSQLTGDAKYYDNIARITSLLAATQNATLLPGMWPTFFNLRDGILTHDTSFTLGALADSLYEYLPKMHALLGGADPVYANMYLHAADTIKRNLLFRPMTSDNADILFSGTVNVQGLGEDQKTLDPEGQHLTCFIGGQVSLFLTISGSLAVLLLDEIPDACD